MTFWYHYCPKVILKASVAANCPVYKGYVVVFTFRCSVVLFCVLYHSYHMIMNCFMKIHFLNKYPNLQVAVTYQGLLTSVLPIDALYFQ